METIEYYHVPAERIGLTLSYMRPDGWIFDNPFDKESDFDKSFDKNYFSATSRDWDGHKPIFRLRIYGKKRYVSITSDILLRANGMDPYINEYTEIKKVLNIPTPYR